VKKNRDELRPEYDLSRLKGGVRGKYCKQATAGTNLVLIEPELNEMFPDAEAVNRALRVLADAAASATGKPNTGKPNKKRIRKARMPAELNRVL